mgnify:CR=1 FL=1|jgi:hypothetical protein
MKNEFLVEGIRVALERGETMKQAMMSFFNAGYGKEEIESAARIVQQEKVTQTQQAVVPQKTLSKKIIPLMKTKTPSPTQVSSYETPSKKITLVLIIKIVLILLALGTLAFVIIFRKELISFVENLF